MKTVFSALALACCALSAAAQTTPEPQFKTSCDDSNWSGNRGENQHYCETRDLTMPAPGSQPLTIDGGTNGGIMVHGWAGSTVRIRAKVQSWASTTTEAQARVKAVTISTANNKLQADASGKEQHYSVSYEVFVPRETALALNTLNGGISLDNVQADIRFHAVNGGVSLASLGGAVRGETVNGGLNITLTGSKWDGKGLDVETTNGGISWHLPRDYSAQLYTSTNMGSLHTGLPVTKTGFMHQEVTASLGKGGAPVRAVTTNGGIHVRQEGGN